MPLSYRTLQRLTEPFTKYYDIQKILLLPLSLAHLISIHTFKSRFFRFRFNIILPSTATSQVACFRFDPLPHNFLFDHVNNIRWAVQIMNLLNV